MQLATTTPALTPPVTTAESGAINVPQVLVIVTFLALTTLNITAVVSQSYDLSVFPTYEELSVPLSSYVPMDRSEDVQLRIRC
jgi:hypothetical protein